MGYRTSPDRGGGCHREQAHRLVNNTVEGGEAGQVVKRHVTSAQPRSCSKQGAGDSKHRCQKVVAWGSRLDGVTHVVHCMWPVGKLCQRVANLPVEGGAFSGACSLCQLDVTSLYLVCLRTCSYTCIQGQGLPEGACLLLHRSMQVHVAGWVPCLQQ
jgi:hypothetical protein